MRDRVFGDLAWFAIDQIDRAGRHAGIGKGRISSAGEAGVSSGALTMTGQPAASAADTLRTTWLIGKFQREDGGRSDRLLHRQLVDALCAGRDDPAVGAARLLGEPVDDIGREQNLYLRLGQRLALLEQSSAGRSQLMCGVDRRR